MIDISSYINKQIFLKTSPKDKLNENNFELKESKLEHIDNNQVLIEVMYISIDAANRAWMQGRTYRSQILPGDVMGGYALGKVIDSKSNKLEFINYNKHGLNYSQTIYNLSKNTKKMISFTDCLQEDCF